MVRLLVVICSFSGGGLSLGCLLYRNTPNVNNNNPTKHPKTNIGKSDFIFNFPLVDDLLLNCSLCYNADKNAVFIYSLVFCDTFTLLEVLAKLFC
jgi:hypothetical protein